MSGRDGRAPSGPWSRLKPVTVDPLESYGLPSKGDNRLLDFKTQERYYTKIVDRYMSFCSRAGRGDELLRRFSSMNLDDSLSTSTSTAAQPPPPSIPAAIPAASTSSSSSSPAATSIPCPPPNLTDPQSAKDLSTLLLAMRKLREGLVATHRIDTFSTQAYIFTIRLCILLRHAESYQPALLYLLYTIHATLPLPRPLLTEFASYHILDLACREGDYAAAYEVRARFDVRDQRLADVLSALVHDDYVAFWRARRAVDGYRARVMEGAEDGVRSRALKCVGRAYLVVQKEWLEGVVGGRRWEELVSRDGVGWELGEGGKVMVRRVKSGG